MAGLISAYLLNNSARKNPAQLCTSSSDDSSFCWRLLTPPTMLMGSISMEQHSQQIRNLRRNQGHSTPKFEKPICKTYQYCNWFYHRMGRVCD